MSYVSFSNEGYNFYNKGGLSLFFCDNSHTALFDYLDTDLSTLPNLLEQYISEILCLDTLELKSNSDGSHLLELIICTLKQSHKYYEYEYKNILVQEISNYFNNWLLYLVYQKEQLSIDDVIEESWYIERINSLVPTSLLPDEEFPITIYDNFIKYIPLYNNFIAKVDPYQSDELQLFISDVYKPVGFVDEIRYQKHLSNMLYFILDISAPDLNTLSLNQRMYLHDKIFYSEFAQPTFRIAKRFPSLACNNNEERETNVYETFVELYKLRSLNITNTGIPMELSKDFSDAINYVSSVTSVNISEEYEINSLRELLFLEIMNMIYSNTIIRKCCNCNKYFTVSDRKIKYCNRITQNDKTCISVGTTNKFKQRLENDEALKLFRRAYKTHNARVSKKKMDINEYDAWKEEAKNKLELVRNGALDILEYQEWLKK